MDKKLDNLPFDTQVVFAHTPLYAKFTVEGVDDEELADFFFGSHTVDAHCHVCGRSSVFKFKSQHPGYGQPKKKLSYRQTIVCEGECSRSGGGSFGLCGNTYTVVFHKHYDVITKIGQFPSAADLRFSEIDLSLRKQLSKKHSKELNTAVGLNAHGVGVGAFVYLRRIFEDFIEMATEEAKKDSDWDSEEFEKSRMAEKIKLLKAHLPRRLVENSALYSVLSKGIHELSEDECRAHFQLLYTSIVAMLKEKAEEKDFDTAVSSVKDLATKLSGKSKADDSLDEA